ncbi:unnamed protein product [Ectocarpus fasciculatus]
MHTFIRKLSRYPSFRARTQRRPTLSTTRNKLFQRTNRPTHGSTLVVIFTAMSSEPNHRQDSPFHPPLPETPAKIAPEVCSKTCFQRRDLDRWVTCHPQTRRYISHLSNVLLSRVGLHAGAQTLQTRHRIRISTVSKIVDWSWPYQTYHSSPK